MFKKRSSIVIVQNNEGKVLLCQRSLNDHWGAGQFAFPGGGVDFLESHSRAAKRELFEETNITANYLSLLGKWTPYIWFYLVRNYSGEVNLAEASHGYEHIDFMWIYPWDIFGLPEELIVPVLRDNLMRYGSYLV